MRVPPALLLLALLCLAIAAPASARTASRLVLMPGVTYEKRVEFTSRGPVVYHVITAPRPGGLYSLRPYLSNNAIQGRERVTEIEKDASTTATVAGVNGDLSSADGRPTGILMRGGALDSPPLAGRSSVGFGGDGSLHVDRITYNGYWKGSSQRRALGLNSPPIALNSVTLYTPAWGPVTPAEKGAVLEQVLSAFPATAPNSDLVAPVTGPAQQMGGTPIPAGGAVLVARGNQIPFLQAEAPVGGRLTVRLTLTPGWTGVTDALGGGPLIVRGGKPVFRANELFSTDLLAARSPRTAVGQLADGRIILVATDGGLPGYSVGMTNFELALTLRRLGAVTASALDAGSSTAMAFDGALLNRPSDRRGEQPVAEALLVAYTGVYAPEPTAQVLSPNDDGVADTETLTFKLVRPATITATLTGPDGVVRPLDQGAKTAVGLYHYPFGGTGVPEGRWKFSVTAVDDLGQSSSTERPFSVNLTLGSLKLPSSVVVRKRGTPFHAAVTLAHPARVTAQVLTAAGAVVRTIASAELPAAVQILGWDGRTSSGTLAYPGRYTLVVTAANEIGMTTLQGTFGLRRG